MKQLLFLLAFALLFPAPAASQAEPGTQQPADDEERARWRDFADAITAQILQDREGMDSRDATVIDMRLSDAWSRADAKRAAGWRRRARETVVKAPANETKAELRKRLNFAQQLVSAASKAGEADETESLLNQLLDSVSAENREGRDSPVRSYAQSLSHAAVASFFEGQREKAARMAHLVISAGGSGGMLGGYLNPLVVADPAVAMPMLGQALEAARRMRYPAPLLADLSSTAMARPESPVAAKLPVEFRNAYFEVLLDRIVGLHNTEPGQGDTCELVSLGAKAMQYFPEQGQAQVRAAVEACKPASLLVRMASNEADVENTPEALLAAAGRAQTPQESGMLRYRAVQLLYGREEVERALEVLDEATTAERDAVDLLNTERSNIAEDVVMKYAAHGNLAEAVQLIERSPAAQRMQLRLALSRWLLGRDQAAAVSVFQEVRRDLDRLQPPDDSFHLYGLFPVVSKLYPGQETDYFRIMVKLVEAMPEEKKQGVMPPWFDLRPLRFAQLFPAVDPVMARAAVADVGSVRKRTSLRLALLESALERVAPEKRAAPVQSPPKPAPEKKRAPQPPKTAPSAQPQSPAPSR